jgi:hypothetical protein
MFTFRIWKELIFNIKWQGYYNLSNKAGAFDWFCFPLPKKVIRSKFKRHFFNYAKTNYLIKNVLQPVRHML